MNQIWEKALLQAGFNRGKFVSKLNAQFVNSSIQYSVSTEKDVYYVEARDSQALAEAALQLSVVDRSAGKLLIQGEQKPKFSLRPLWLFGEEYAASSGGISLPSFDEQSHDEITTMADRYALTLLGMGLNGLILGDPWKNPIGTTNHAKVKTFLSRLKAYGIHLYALVTPSLDEPPSMKDLQSRSQALKEDLESSFQELDGILVFAKMALTFDERTPFQDRLLQQMDVWSQAAGHKKVLFHLDLHQLYDANRALEWSEELIDYAPQNLSLVVAPYIGRGDQVSTQTNPFLSVLKRESRLPMTILLNTGGVNWGEGLWPTPMLSLHQEMTSLLERKSSIGPILMTRFLPRKCSYFRGVLWAAGQSQWQGRRYQDFLSFWLENYLQVESQEPAIELLLLADQLLLDLQKVKSLKNEKNSMEERLKLLLAQASLLQVQLKGQKGLGELVPLCMFFVRDVRKLVLLWSQEHKIRLQHVAEGDDLKDSFWVQVHHSSKGLGGSVQGKFLETPHTSTQEPLLEQLLNVSR